MFLCVVFVPIGMLGYICAKFGMQVIMYSVCRYWGLYVWWGCIWGLKERCCVHVGGLCSMCSIGESGLWGGICVGFDGV